MQRAVQVDTAYLPVSAQFLLTGLLRQLGVIQLLLSQADFRWGGGQNEVLCLTLCLINLFLSSPRPEDERRKED